MKTSPPVQSGRRVRRSRRQKLLPKALALAVASCFAADLAMANPNGFAVVNGQVTFNYNGNTLTITNTPGSIINWQSFSIGTSELTRFIQQSAASSVLNRVIGIDPSIILGALQSNGRVFLINPNGILFGAGAQIDVAGLVASTLNLSNGDFLAGRLRFTDTPGAGSLVNQGAITTPSGGQVYLIAPNVQNTGIITSPQGEIILAAGRSVELVDAGTPGLRVEITAPDTEAVNVGQIIANSGKIGIYAGLIRNSGVIRADGVVVGANGEILLKATQNTTLDADSIVSASGAQGGKITLQSGDTTLVSGTVEAKGTLSPTLPLDGGGQGGGGTIKVLGDRVGLIDNATINASGETGGGTVLIGGDYQGRNPDIQNARQSLVGANAFINADAITSGDGGKVIVWGNDSTQFYGTITARGGAQSGNGGFVETSGHWLDFSGTVNTLAPHGAAGTLLLDPHNIIVAIGGLALLTDVDQFADTPGTDSTIAPATINAAASNVVLQANNDVTFTDAVNIATGGVSLTAQAGRSILVNANITTNNADVRLTANETVGNGVSGANRDAGAATLSMAPGTTINAGLGNIYLRMNDGSGHAGTSGNIVVENLNADNVSIIHDGLTANSSILRASGGSLLSANAVFMELESASGASASIGTAAAPIRVSTPILEAHYHNASGGIFIDSPNPENLQIGGVPGFIFSGLVRGVQTVSGGPISIAVNGDLSQLAGAAGCGLTGGTGGPICAGAGGSLTLAVTGSDINLNSFVNAGTATLTATGDINVQNATVNSTGAMNVTATNNLNVIASTAFTQLQSTGLQTISANGVTVQGAASGTGLNAQITSNGGQNITVGAGGITVTGGAGGTNNGAFIQQFGALNDQTITVNGGGTVALTGGGGTQNPAQIQNQGLAQSLTFTAGGALNLLGGSGAGGQNRAEFGNQGAGATTQTISFTGGGAINATGGTVGQENGAGIHANTGNQTITGNPDITLTGGASGGAPDNSNDANINLKLGATGVQTINAGNISLTGGAGGIENVAIIGTETSGQTQVITATGSVTLTGGAGTDAVAGIASNNSNVNITLNANGPVTLTGGSGGFSTYGAIAAIGVVGGFTANVTVNGQAGITLNKGTGPGANAFIGSDTGGGTIVLKAGLGGAGDIELNDGVIRTTGNVTLQTAATGLINIVSGSVTAGGNITVSGMDFLVGNAGATQPATVTAGGDLVVGQIAGNPLPLTGTMKVQGGTASGGNDASATVHANGNVFVKADKVEIRGGSANAFGGEGGNETANANAELSAGQSMTLTVGSGGLNVIGGNATAGANSSGVATANANALVSAGTGLLTVTVTSGGMIVQGGAVTATASSNGSATARATSTVTSTTGDVDITVSAGGLTVAGGNNGFARVNGSCCPPSPSVIGRADADASATLSAPAGNMTLDIAGGLQVMGGDFANIFASYAFYSLLRLAAKAEISARDDLTVKVSSGGLQVRGGDNANSGFFDNNFSDSGGGMARLDVSASLKTTAGGTLRLGTMANPIVGGILIRGGDNARARASDSFATHDIVVDANAKVSGNNVEINVTGTVAGCDGATAAGLCVRGGDNAFASASSDGAKRVTVNANAELSATNNLTITAPGGIIVRGGDSATASAMGSGASGHVIATNANALVSAGNQLEIKPGTTFLTVRGGDFASATASDSGRHTATTNANGTLHAGNTMIINVSGAVMVRGGDNASATASSAGPGGVNTALTNANGLVCVGGLSASLACTPSGSLTMTAGSLTVRGGNDASASALYAGGSNNATANVNAAILGGSLDLTVNGPVNIQGGSDASAEASSGTGPGTRQTAIVNANATVRGSSSLILRVTSGDLTVAGGDGASAEASSAFGVSQAIVNAKGELSTGGTGTIIVSAGNVMVRGGNNASAEADASSAAANGIGTIDATGRIAAGGNLILTVSSGSVSIAGGSNAFASADGDAGPLPTQRTTASTNVDATISAGGSLTLDASSLSVAGGNNAGALASDWGVETAVTTANALLLSGGGMSLTVAGPITVAGGNNAYAIASNLSAGAVIQAATGAGALIGAGGGLTMNTGSLTISGGVQSSFNSATTSGSGANSAITLANASVLSGGDFNYTGGTVNLNGGTARTNGGVGAAGATTAQADAGIGVSGAKTMTITGSLNIIGGSALDDGLDAANGIAQARAILDPGDMNVTTTGDVNITGGSVTGNGSAYAGLTAQGAINIDIGGPGGLFITGGLTGPVGTGIFADPAGPITITYSGGGMENITVNPALDGAYIQSFEALGGSAMLPDPVQIVINSIIDSINQSTQDQFQQPSETSETTAPEDKDKDKSPPICK